MKESRLKGHFIGGSILYGYKIVDKKPVGDEIKAKTVWYAFNEYAKGYRTSKGKPFIFNNSE